MLKKISNLRVKFQILIRVGYMFCISALFIFRMNKFKFLQERRTMKEKKSAREQKYEFFTDLAKVIKGNLIRSLKLYKYCIYIINQEFLFFVKLKTNSVSSDFHQIIGCAWLCEKLHIDFKFAFSDKSNFFENSVLMHPKDINYRQKPKKARLKAALLFINFVRSKITSQYGYKIISQLTIKRDLQQQADEWTDNNLRGDWLGVHYRGTDAIFTCKHRFIEIETYIAYLKEVLEDRYSIFACSDQAQFIEQIHSTFPGRVYSRDITRSDDETTLHKGSEYAGVQQKQDALIDLLILSKASLVYTPGSYFVDAVRFLNPSIKIISLDGRKVCYKHIPNYLSVPKPLINS